MSAFVERSAYLAAAVSLFFSYALQAGTAYADEAAAKSAEAVPPDPVVLAPVEVGPAEKTAKKPRPLFQHTSYPAAWKAAQKSNRPILLFISMPSCPHCVKMLDQTYHRAGVEQVVRGSFETVYVSRHTHAQLVSKLNIKWYPTTILVSPNNRMLDKIEGYLDAKAFGRRLQTGIAAVQVPTQTR